MPSFSTFRLRLRVAAVAAAALMLLLPEGRAGEAVPEYRLKAELIERLSRFVEWPQTSLPSDPSAPFVIGVLGRDPFGRHLDEMAGGRRIQGHPVRIVRVNRIEEVGEPQMIFVASGEVRSIPRVVERAREKGILTVGDTPGFGDAGVMINFFSDGDRVRFEINEEEARRAGLRISSKVRRLARPAGEETP